MESKIQKWGNSQGIRLTKHILDEAQIHTGDTVHIMVINKTIVIEPSIPKRGKKNLKQLISKMPTEYTTQEEWNQASGKEVW